MAELLVAGPPHAVIAAAAKHSDKDLKKFIFHSPFCSLRDRPISKYHAGTDTVTAVSATMAGDPKTLSKLRTTHSSTSPIETSRPSNRSIEVTGSPSHAMIQLK